MSYASHVIEYIQGTDIRKVVISVPDGAAEIMQKALKSDALRGKEKEELAAALTEALRGRAALLVERYKNRERHDADDGTAAIESFDVKGMAVLWKHFDSGNLQDAPDGEPAIVVLANGDFTYARSFTKGQSNKTLTPEERTEARWAWAKKNARPAPAGNAAPGPGSSPKKP